MRAVLVITAVVSYLPHALAPGAWSVLPDIPVSGEIEDPADGIGDADTSVENTETTDESECDGQQMPVFPPVVTGGEIALPQLTYIPRALKSGPVSAKATLFFARGYGYIEMDPTSVLVTRVLRNNALPIKSHAPPAVAKLRC